jgi:hypothetical protein
MEPLLQQGSPNPAPNRHRTIKLTVSIALGAWLLLVVALGMAGGFVGPPHAPPLAMGVAVAAPLLLFWSWTRLSRSFRDFVLSLDLRLIAGVQGWRWAGFGFLALYAHKVLPAIFAMPAGLGDMAIGATAPWVVLALLRRPGFATSKAFTRWNLLGMLDLAVAVSIGTLSAMFATGAPGEVSTAAMATLPLVLIPAFGVPMFFILHIAALTQSAEIRRRDRLSPPATPKPAAAWYATQR